MRIAKVQGTVVSTIKHPTYEGHKLLWCQPLDFEGRPSGPAEIAADRVQAGVGDTVLIMREGNGTRQILGADAGPILDLVVGVIDSVTLNADTDTDASDQPDS